MKTATVLTTISRVEMVSMPTASMVSFSVVRTGNCLDLVSPHLTPADEIHPVIHVGFTPVAGRQCEPVENMPIPLGTPLRSM
jgi:hypothetical protein